MIKQILYFLLSCALLWGCADAPDSVNPNHSGLVAVEIPLTPEEVRPVSRATDESVIKDVNLFLFGKTNGQRYRIYAQTPKLRLECLPGEYDLYVVANYHADMGDKTPAELAGFKIPYKWTYNDLPMSACESVTIAASSSGTVTLPAIEVRRNVAKVVYNIAVAKSVSDIRLASARVCTMPLNCSLFSNSTPSAASSDYADGELMELTTDNSNHYSGMTYLFENCQGRVSSITSQNQKNSANAPKFASYLLIRATRGGKVLDYKIYLGENNTDDFNVRRNTSHTLNITIMGDNEADTRVHSYTIDVYDDIGAYNFGGYCIPEDQRTLMVRVSGNAHKLAFSGELEVESGFERDFAFEQTSIGASHTFNLSNVIGTNYYVIDYFPSLITKAQSELKYSVSICDQYQFWQTYELSHRYANHVFAYVQFGTSPNGKGSVTASNALYTNKISSKEENIRALCYEDGCTFTATPATGYKFSGWYSDAAFTKLLSTTAVYNFKPTFCYSSLYAKFELDKSFVEIRTNIWDVTFTCEKSYTTDQDRESFTVPYGSRCTITVDTDVPLFSGWYDTFNTTSRKLVSAERTYSFTATDDMTLALGYINSTRLDAAGTANCYIAPPGGGYKFYAMTMGNGKATTGITPSRLYGTVAKVIWETGLTHGAIIKEAAYSPMNGMVSFVTGQFSGNAVIGLFDQNDVCVWSWHIWVTTYNPLSTAQTYSGGRIFMDRNLGALSSEIYDASFRGLYYQWGRKDPFVYPASTTVTYTASSVYHPDYGFEVSDPIMGYGKMTIEWAINHPWMFMYGVLNNDDRTEDIKDWLSPQNPNLWGNTSSQYVLSDGGSKSIYDPCPPGWRVPDRRAWADAGVSILSSSSTDCYYLNTGYSSAAYPKSGYTFNGQYFQKNGSESYVWSNAPAQWENTTKYWKAYSTVLSITPSSLNPLNKMTRDSALPVRCVKE